MEKKMTLMNLAELWNISVRLNILHSTMVFITDAMDDSCYGNITAHMADALGRIAGDFNALLDNADVLNNVTVVLKKSKEEMKEVMKKVTVDLAELLDILTRLNAAGCVPEIAADLSRLIDRATVSDKAAQYLWNRMLKTGKTRFTRNDIHKLTTNSRLLPTMDKAYWALDMLTEQKKISKTLTRVDGSVEIAYVIGKPDAVNTTEGHDATSEHREREINPLEAAMQKYRSHNKG